MNQSFKIYTDGGARGNPGPAAAAFVVINEGKVYYKKAKFLGKTTNNFAEYWGIILALNWLSKNTKTFQEKEISIFVDSQLVARQLAGLYRIKSNKLRPLSLLVKKLEKKILKKVKYEELPRERNRLADALVNKIIDENI